MLAGLSPVTRCSSDTDTAWFPSAARTRCALDPSGGRPTVVTDGFLLMRTVKPIPASRYLGAGSDAASSSVATFCSPVARASTTLAPVSGLRTSCQRESSRAFLADVTLSFPNLSTVTP